MQGCKQRDMYCWRAVLAAGAHHHSAIIRVDKPRGVFATLAGNMYSLSKHMDDG